ncbi:unnamed protein product [Paramecium primaurelia]|uniref:Uncharacterized protein n=1 Tax=Paramecium primaurelia TaxID=5886 RepID=A0A8S1NKQ4_PARPR|nr:unnamed protein product [Paramecium primaurelia]
MKQISESAHILQKVYNPKKMNKLFMTTHYQLQNETDLIFDKFMVMPLFGLSVANGISSNCIKAKYLCSDYKKQELYDCNLILIMSAYSDQAVYRSKTMYSKRDGLEQIFKYLAIPNQTYNIHISLLSYFVPQRVFYKQVLQALNIFELLDQKHIEELTKSSSIINQLVDDDNLDSILFKNQEFIDYQKWRKLLKNNAIINLKTLHQHKLSQQIFCQYFFKYHYYQGCEDEIIKLNKFLVDDFDMFKFRFRLEHNEKKMKFYFLRMLSYFKLNEKLEKFLKFSFKSYSLDWNKELLRELKCTIYQYKKQ